MKRKNKSDMIYELDDGEKLNPETASFPSKIDVEDKLIEMLAQQRIGLPEVRIIARRIAIEAAMTVLKDMKEMFSTPPIMKKINPQETANLGAKI